MNLILTMAGKYSRFVNAGFKFPKYLLPWGDRSILSEILKELSSSNDFDQIFLITNFSDEVYSGHVQKIMKTYNIDENNLIMLYDTKGQAETAYLGLIEIEKRKKITGPVVFHNIDTILYNRDIKYIKNSLEKFPAYIDVFKSNNHEFSYIIAENNFVKKICEKVLISDIATSGLYGFSSSKLFLDYYKDENYISDVYQKLLNNNILIHFGNVYNEKDTIVLGTPADYLNQSKAINYKG